MTQHWYPFYWSDYSGDTFDLSQGQHGAYILLLRFIYTSGKRISHDQCYSIARAVSEQEKTNVSEVLRRYFKRDGDEWFHSRCDEVMGKADEAHQKRVNAGKQGGKAKAERSSNAKAMPKQSSSNQNHNQNHIDNTNVLSPPISPRGRSGYSPEFETFWQTYPNRTGKTAAYKAYQGAIKQHGLTHEQLLDRAGKFADAHKAAGTPAQYIPHPTTWLNQGRWEDDLSRIKQRQDTTRPAPAANGRGSQFNALMAATSELLQEQGGHMGNGQPGLSERMLAAPVGLQPTGWLDLASLPGSAGQRDPAGTRTIHHDDVGSTDG